MNPVRSEVCTGTFPTRFANASASSQTFASVAMVRITSTNFISGTGLKKCNPMKRSGRRVRNAISVIESEEVLLEKIVCFPQIWSSAAYNSRFSGNCSIIASTIRSASARSSSFVVPRRRARVASRSFAESVPFSTNFARLFSMDCRPLFNRSSFTSRTVTVQPACAAIWAIPEPIKPQPTTPTFSMAIVLLESERFRPPIRAVRLHHGFHNHRDSLAAADARGCQPVALIAPPQFQEQGQNQPRAGRAQRMPQGYRSAVHVGFIAIQSQRFLDRQILRRKRFVDFDQIHLLELQPRKL